MECSRCSGTREKKNWQKIILVKQFFCPRFQSTFADKFTRGDIPNTCKSPDVVARCVQKADLDVIFLVDTSDHQQGFDKAKDLIRSVVQCLRVSKDETNVSIVRYRNQANIDLPLQSSKPKLLTYLKKMTNGQTTKNTRSFLGKAFSYLSTANKWPISRCNCTAL